MANCRWVRDPGIGRYLVPGCMNRAVYGDYAACHCAASSADRLGDLETQVSTLRAKVKSLEATHHDPAR